MPWSGVPAWPQDAALAPAEAQLRAARQRSVGGLCADLQADPPPGLAAWCAALRRARLVPMLRVRLDRLDDALLDRLEAAAPLLVVLAPATGGLAHGARVREVLARRRSPHLRFADSGLAHCHRGLWQPDLWLAGGPVPRAALDPRCRHCGAVHDCPGPPSAADPVQPLPAAVSNQFDLCVAGDPHDPAPACPPMAPELTLHVLQGGRAQPFALQGQQADAAAVHQAILRGQLYLDVSEKARLDDFAADLRLLQPVHAPHATPQGLCAGSWQVAEQQPFAAEEAALRAVLATLRGTVIDVGAGPIHYLRELQKAMDEGLLRYIAVEPDRGALLASREALPAGLHLEGTGEHLPLADASADAVMMLRSFNHLHDPHAALREAARVLRPGGLLLLVDNVLFGLLRTDEQRRRAHAIPVTQTPFEHFRNADAALAIALLQDATAGAFRVARREEVGPGRSNQWMVLAQRIGTADCVDS